MVIKGGIPWNKGLRKNTKTNTCVECAAKTSNTKYCSMQCYKIHSKKNKLGFYNSKIQKALSARSSAQWIKKNPIILYNCYGCGKKIRHHKFCSHSCYIQYSKKNKLGFYNSVSQTILAKKGGTACQKQWREQGKECFTTEQRKKGVELQVKTEIGWWSKENKAKSAERCRKASLTNNPKNKVAGVQYASLYESDFVRLLIANNVNFVSEFHIGLKRIDFKIGNIFVEIHPETWRSSETSVEYYTRRRLLLDNNGYKQNDLILLTDKESFVECVNMLAEVQ